MQKDTLIVSIVYFNYDIIIKHLDFLTTVNDRADIIVLENYSENTPNIKEYCLDLIEKQKIFQYWLFDQNIGMNVFETYFRNNKINQYKYIIVTDGDLTVQDPLWMEEQKKILDKPNTYACGVKLSLINLPLKSFPEAKYWYPKPIRVEKDCEVGVTGLCLLMYKTHIFQKFLDHLYKTNDTFMDTTMHPYCNNVLKKIWRRTKNAEAYHLTWDLYKDRNNEYTKIKITKSREELWFHKNYCNYTVYDHNSSYRNDDKTVFKR